MARLDPDDYHLPEQRRDELPGLTYENTGWKIDFRAIPKSELTRGREGIRPLGVFGGVDGRWVQDEDEIRSALSDKGSAYGTLRAPFVVAVATSSSTLDDHAMLNTLFGMEVLELRTFADGTETTATARKPDGYWYRGDHWAHRGVSAVLIVRNIHPAFVGTQAHTIWEHPEPEFAVDEFPIWRRCVPGDGTMSYFDPVDSQAEWFGLSHPWPVGEPFPR